MLKTSSTAASIDKRQIFMMASPVLCGYSASLDGLGCDSIRSVEEVRHVCGSASDKEQVLLRTFQRGYRRFRVMLERLQRGMSEPLAIRIFCHSAAGKRCLE